MSGLTHLDEHGAARMVDVGAKPVSQRKAVAEGRIRMSGEALAALWDGTGRSVSLPPPPAPDAPE